MLNRLLNGGDDPPTLELSQDVAFDLLSNSRRRKVIREVESTGAPLDLDYLSEVIAMMETGAASREDVSYRARKRVYVSLYQTHLPKLDDWDVIRFGERNNRVISASNGPGLLAIMNSVSEVIDP